jgi:hypothetical protein
VSRSSIASIVSLQQKELLEGQAIEAGPEEEVFVVRRRGRDSKIEFDLRVGGMNLTLTKEQAFVSSIQYTELSRWEHSTLKQQSQSMLTLVKKPPSDERVVLITPHAQEICSLMSAHTKVLLARRAEERRRLAQEQAVLARNGKLVGEFVTQQRVQARKGKLMVTDVAGVVENRCRGRQTVCA